MPRVLSAMFSKQKPKEAPPIPDYDTFIKQYNSKDGKYKNNEATEEDTFVDYMWWKKDPNKEPVTTSDTKTETVVGGEQAFKVDEVKSFLDDSEIDDDGSWVSDFLAEQYKNDEE